MDCSLPCPRSLWDKLQTCYPEEDKQLQKMDGCLSLPDSPVSAPLLIAYFFFHLEIVLTSPIADGIEINARVAASLTYLHKSAMCHRAPTASWSVSCSFCLFS